MFGWSAVDIPMFALLPVLLVLSGFFSGSETALFALTQTERMTLRRQATLASRAVDALLADSRMLLITILVGNMTINVLYFVVTSVLLMKTQGVLSGVLLGIMFLVVIILLGEVIPKLIANSARSRIAGLVAPILLTLHQLLGPVRITLESLVVAPLSRLTSPPEPPRKLDEEELGALFEMAGSRGVIDREEQRILGDVMNLSQRKVRDVMTPRVRVAALPIEAEPAAIRSLAEQTRLTKFPVYRGDLDHVVGICRVRDVLLTPPGAAPIRRLGPVHFVPEISTLDQLLNHFRETRTQLAVVVDEYGGTAGVVAIEDVVEELVGDIASVEERRQRQPRQIGPNRWRISADMSVHDWAEAFGQRLVSPQVATLGGLIFARLGRVPRPSDVVELGNVRLEVERVDRSRVVSVLVSLVPDDAEAGEAS